MRSETLQTNPAQRVPQRLLHGLRHGVGVQQGSREGAGLVRQEAGASDRPQRFFRRMHSDRGHYELVGNFDKIKTANHGKMANGSAGIVIAVKLFLPPL